MKFPLIAALAWAGAVFLGSGAANAQAERPGSAIDYADEAAEQRGDRSELLVLGTSHLSSLPDDFDTSRLDPLIDALATWGADRIAVESTSGPVCDYGRLYDFYLPGNADTWCSDPQPARTALGMTAPQAAEQIESILAAPNADRAPSVRRRLAALFLATGDPASALVQWLRLPIEERISGDGLEAELVADLESRRDSISETYAIAVPLAARLGHERVYPVDDQTPNRWEQKIEQDQQSREIYAVWDNPAAHERNELIEAQEDGFLEGGSVLEWYRILNSQRMQDFAVRADFGAAAGSEDPAPRQYLAYWETRNMRMVANLREVIGDRERRVLAIVGASHKPYYERYISVSSDVVLADVDDVLLD